MSEVTEWSVPFTGPEMKALCLPVGVIAFRQITANDYLGEWDLDDGRPEFQLPADHPAVKVALHNREHGTSFAYWPGGDAAPEDWDGGDVLRVGSGDGDIDYPDPYVGPYARNQRWGLAYRGAVHGVNFADIIGYQKRAEQTEAPATDDEPQWVCDRVNAMRRDGTAYSVLARYIAQHEQPPVDPDLIEARKLAAENGRERGKSDGSYRTYNADKIENGEYDDNPLSGVPLALAALKRGRELALDS